MVSADVPYSKLSPLKRPADEIQGGGGFDREPPAKKTAFMAILHYHPKIKAAWEGAINLLRNVQGFEGNPSVNKIVGFVKDDQQNPWRIKNLAKKYFKDCKGCVVGHITGKCTNVTCINKHDTPAPPAAVDALCTIITEGARLAKESVA